MYWPFLDEPHLVETYRVTFTLKVILKRRVAIDIFTLKVIIFRLIKW